MLCYRCHRAVWVLPPPCPSLPYYLLSSHSLALAAFSLSQEEFVSKVHSTYMYVRVGVCTWYMLESTIQRVCIPPILFVVWASVCIDLVSVLGKDKEKRYSLECFCERVVVNKH